MRKKIKSKTRSQKNNLYNIRKNKRQNLSFVKNKNDYGLLMQAKYKFLIYFLIFFIVSGNFFASLFVIRNSSNNAKVSKITSANAGVFENNDNAFLVESIKWGAPKKTIFSQNVIASPESDIEDYISGFVASDSWGAKNPIKIAIPASKVLENQTNQEIKIASYQPQNRFPDTGFISKDIDPIWRKNAVLAPMNIKSKPLIAIIIDDLGIDRKRTAEILSLPAPLTASFLTYAGDLKRQTDIAKKYGHEIMLHIPMEPDGRGYDPGPDVLKISMNDDEIIDNLKIMLDKIDGYVGINNHMGSKFTADSRAMGVVINELYDNGLLFVDSMTSSDSIGLSLADKKGVPSVPRSVFLDNLPSEQYALNQLRKLEQNARLNGYAVGIGHPRDGTIAALAKWLQTVEDNGFLVVPVSHIVKYRNFPSEFALK